MKVLIRRPKDKEKEIMKKCEIWEHKKGVFDWEYKDKQETCLIIKGSASVKGKNESAEYFFKEGDLVTFPTNWDCQWKITEDMKKYYIFDYDFNS
ncbi:cupin domain-containing protein [Anaerofustis stercorihominis]|uniref:cupin domain-containing protein n=1 Tax=Anaerofustis stercorihominis TaxID=214853 RepID=UPI00210913AA|nr:cupin domain-containing protein [Anaerofustis stercorihominis]MCQ4796146.1 cupin domain-containing protein [Anaerofustis stercorihominis]